MAGGKAGKDTGKSKQKTLKSPKGPTKQEEEDHAATHMPFKAWCRHCVRGRGRNCHHRSQESERKKTEGRRVHKIAMDYFFLTEEEKEAGTNPFIVMVEETTGDRHARTHVARKDSEKGPRCLG